MSNAPPPLPPELADMLASEQELDAVSPELQRGIWDGVEKAIAAGPSGGGGDDGGSPAPPPAAPPSGLARLTSVAAVTAVVAGTLGFALGRGSAPAPQPIAEGPRTSVVVAASAAPTPEPPVAPTSAITPRDLPSAISTHVAEPVSSAPRTTKDAGASSDFSAERSLLERARSALARGDGPGAMEAIVEHQRRFAAGSLVEEREAMAVRALLSSGRRADAEKRAAAFRDHFPKSLFAATLDAELDGGR
jgi:hypothetical protein